MYALGFQHSPRDLANVNEWKILFDPYIEQESKVISLFAIVMEEPCVHFSDFFFSKFLISVSVRIVRHPFRTTSFSGVLYVNRKKKKK